MRPHALVLACLLVTVGCLGSTPDTDPAGETDQAPAVIESRLTPENESASEVSVAINPADPQHVVAAANSEGGFGVYVSEDAGASWEADRFDPEDASTVSDEVTRFTALSDPVVDFSPDGERVYLAALAYLPTSAVIVAVSEDGGRSFDEVHVVDESEVAGQFNDKEWLGVNPHTGTLLVAWQKEPALDQLRDVEGETGVDADVGRIVVSRSTDEGQTWSQPAEVSRGLHNNGTAIAFTENGKAHVTWVNYEENTLDYVSSTDDGESFSDPRGVADVYPVPSYPRYQRMHTLPGLAADPNSSTVAAIWHDDRNGDADVHAVASPDAGETWGKSVRVHPDSVDDGAAQIYPWIDVGPDGRVHASWYDARADPDKPRFAYYHASAPGPGLNFTPGQAVSNQTFAPFCEAPDSCEDQRSLGDYTGLAVGPAGVVPAWSDGRGEVSRIHAASVPLE